MCCASWPTLWYLPSLACYEGVYVTGIHIVVSLPSPQYLSVKRPERFVKMIDIDVFHYVFLCTGLSVIATASEHCWSSKAWPSVLLGPTDLADPVGECSCTNLALISASALRMLQSPRLHVGDLSMALSLQDQYPSSTLPGKSFCRQAGNHTTVHLSQCHAIVFSGTADCTCFWRTSLSISIRYILTKSPYWTVTDLGAKVPGKWTAIFCVYLIITVVACTKEEVPEQALLSELPLHLRGEAVSCFLDSVFRQLEVFQHQRHQVLTLLASCLHPHTTLPGHNLSRQGSVADRIWILQSGKH